MKSTKALIEAAEATFERFMKTDPAKEVTTDDIRSVMTFIIAASVLAIAKTLVDKDQTEKKDGE